MLFHSVLINIVNLFIMIKKRQDTKKKEECTAVEGLHIM